MRAVVLLYNAISEYYVAVAVAIAVKALCCIVLQYLTQGTHNIVVFF
jgi:hypothetical protein